MTETFAPGFLVAMPTLLDPNFFQSVVLLCKHDEEGAFGLVINQRMELTVAEVCAEAKIPWNGDADQRAFFGGPVERQRGWLLHGDEDLYEGSERIADGLALSASQEALAAYAEQPEGRFRLVLGYAGWGEGQLDEEIRSGSWLTAPLDTRLLFEVAPERAWQEALKLAGADPAQLVGRSRRDLN